MPIVPKTAKTAKRLMTALGVLSLALLASLTAPAPTNAQTTQTKPELTVYTYDSFAAEWGPGPQIKAQFEQICSCTVNFVGLDTSVSILGRLQLEGDNTQADVILGLDTSFTEQARATGLFAPHGLNLDGKLNLPAPVSSWNDAEFIPVDWGYFAFVYDSARLSNPPNSFLELIDSNTKILIQDARTATPGTGLMLWVEAAYGAKAGEIWAGLAPRIVTVTKGWWDSYSLFLEGEADMVLSYSTSPAYHAIAEGKDNFAAAAFAEGHYMQVEVAGIVNSSQNKDLARDFLAFVLGEQVQSVIPTTNWMYPAAANTPLPDGFAGLIVPEKSLLFPPKIVQENRKKWVNIWLEGLSQ